MKQLTFNKKQKLDSTVNKEINNKLQCTYFKNYNQLQKYNALETMYHILAKMACS